MATLIWPLLRSASRIFSAIFVRRSKPRSDRIRGVILHDPDAQKAKDFDNPFYTAAIQERVGDLIARSGTSGKPDQACRAARAR